MVTSFLKSKNKLIPIILLFNLKSKFNNIIGLVKKVKMSYHKLFNSNFDLKLMNSLLYDNI